MCWVTSTDAPIESPTIQIRPFTTSGNQTGNPPSSASLERVSFASLLLPLASTPCDDISALSVFSEEEEDDDDDSARGVLIITRDVFLVNTPLLFSARRLFPFEDRAKEDEDEDEEDAESGAIVGISSLFCETRRFERNGFVKVCTNQKHTFVVVSFQSFFCVWFDLSAQSQ